MLSISSWMLILVSIHASAREATSLRLPLCLWPLRFNPRLRTGGDVFFRLVKCAVEVFQSTPPHGRRLYCLCNLVFLPNVSIHASAREAT